MQTDRYIAAADIGSSKIAFGLAKVVGEDVQILHYSNLPSRGVSDGVIIAPQHTAEVLKGAIEAAEKELDLKITQLVVGGPRYNITHAQASASMNRSDPDSGISREELGALKDMAIASLDQNDKGKQEVYEAVVQSFSADDFIGATEKELIGVAAENLEGHFNIFYAAKRSMRNIELMINHIGIGLSQSIFSPQATAEAVLQQSEKENGVALIELGAGVSSVIIYKKQLIRHFASIPFGGKHVSLDIHRYYGIDERLAENIKLAFGACLPDKLFNLGDKILQITDNDNGTYQDIPVRQLSEVISARMKEIFEALLYYVHESGYGEGLRNGIVLSGGGANLVNAGKMLREMSGYPVRIGYPITHRYKSGGFPGAGETAASSTIGLILEACKYTELNCAIEQQDTASRVRVILETTETPNPELSSEPSPKASPESINEPALEPNSEPVAENSEEKPEGYLFSESEIGVPMKKKKKKRKGFKESIVNLVEEIADKTIGSLYDNMDTKRSK